MSSAQGMACCVYCGAQIRLYTIFNRDMQGLAKGWKKRHEARCKKRTPAQRVKWAKPYVGKEWIDSTIVVDLTHPGFNEPEQS